MKTRVLFSIVVLLTSASALFAQSGRKSNSSSSSTTTTTTPSVAGPKPTEKKAAATPKVQLLVGVDRRALVTSVPYYVFDTVLDNVIRRLGEAEIVFATSGGDMNRPEGVKMAKQEKARWVVVLEIRSIYADSGQLIKNNQDELAVSFISIEPETGKIKRSGQARTHIYQNGRGGISLPSKNGGVYSDYSIKQAAIEAADRILAGFDITVGQGTRF
jgi:hypothetical protein